MKNKILHITPHMGGGVGNVISGFINQDKENYHKAVLLENPIEIKYIFNINDYENKIAICPTQEILIRYLEWSDIVIVHWWHHPLTSNFLYHLPKIPLRIVIWSHISNLTVPMLSPKFIEEATMVFFTTESSYDEGLYQKVDSKILDKKTVVVPGTIGYEESFVVKKRAHNNFNIGYLGYVDFSKLHPQFIEFCDEVKVNNAKFVMGGEAPVKKILEIQAREKGLNHKFEYKGYIEDIYDFYSTIDVLGYPLMPNHTCTTENSILEAMLSEIPPVLINQLVEKHMVIDGENGFLVSNPKEYGKAIKILYANNEKRLDMGKNARKFVLSKYGRKKILINFQKQCEEVANLKKKIFEFDKIIGNTPDQWFLSGLREEKIFFEKNNIGRCSDILKGENKASIKQYARYFKENQNLKNWESLLLNFEG